MIKDITRASIGLGVALLLTGCVVSLGGDSNSREANWQQNERNNREQIARLEPGMRLDEVTMRMGAPDFSEAFVVGEEEVRVLFYRTHRSRADGMTTRDETTPLVFSGGVLNAWGDVAYQEWFGRVRAGY